MSQLRKFTSLVLWFLLISAIVSGFLWFYARKTQSVDLISLLPQGTAIIFEFTSFPSFVDKMVKDNKMWDDISKPVFPDQSGFTAKRLDSLMKQNARMHEYLGKKICISVSLKANKTPGILYCLQSSVRNQDKLLLKFFSEELSEFTYSKRRYEGSNIYDLSWKEESQTGNFSFTSLKGALIGSFSSELVEESVKQYHPEKNISNTPEFQRVFKTAGNMVPLNVYLDYQYADEILRYFMNPSNTKQFSGILNLASWGAFDAEIFTDKIILNGFTSLNDSLNQELSILKSQEPVVFNCPDFLPEQISFLRAYGFSDKELFFKQLAKFMQRKPGSKELSDRKTALLKDFGIDLDKGFAEMINDEYGFAVMQSGQSSQPFFFMELKSQSLAEEQFLRWLDAWAAKNGKDPAELMLDYKIDSHNTIKVYKLPIGGIPALVFGTGFSSPGNDYFTFVNNYIVFANSFSSLKEFIYQVILGNNISSGSSYLSLGEDISSRSNLFVFAKPSSFVELDKELFSEPAQKFIKKGKESISKFNALSLQYTAAGELLYSRFFVNYSETSSGSVKTVWESRIDTSIIFKPAIVVNHVTKEKEIFIQDQKNQVYLLSNAGIVLWKRMLEGSLKSDIFQVDYFGNGKLQYLFSTKNKIYLLDRNGNDVEKYPVNLRSPSTAGISVFDYDGDGTIRICVPGEDRKIYMYDKEGKVIPGWQPNLTDNEVSRPVQHFRVGNKDYIVAIDKYKFYILDRKGNNRVPVKQFFQVSLFNSFYLDVSKGNELARLVTTDTSGSIIRVYFSGKVEKILDRKINSNHYFIFTDLDGDRKAEFLSTYGNVLQVLDHTLSERFKIELEDNISFRPVVYQFSNTDNKIGIVLKNPGNIYLYDYNGTLYNGFPLKGASPFSISSFPKLGGRFNMVVGSQNSFLYNYSVK
jgi:hypothetical protein